MPITQPELMVGKMDADFNTNRLEEETRQAKYPAVMIWRYLRTRRPKIYR